MKSITTTSDFFLWTGYMYSQNHAHSETGVTISTSPWILQNRVFTIFFFIISSALSEGASIKRKSIPILEIQFKYIAHSYMNSYSSSIHKISTYPMAFELFFLHCPRYVLEVVMHARIFPYFLRYLGFIGMHIAGACTLAPGPATFEQVNSKN